MKSLVGWLQEHVVLLGFLLMYLAGPVVLVGMGISDMLEQSRLRDTGVAATAIVVERYTESQDDSTSYRLLLELPGQDDARRVHMTTSRDTWTGADPGANLRVTLDPEDPSAVYLGDPNELDLDGSGTLWGGIGLGVFMLAAFWFA